MPTTALERLEKKTIKAKQKEARAAQAMARIKEDAKTTRSSILRDGGMYHLELEFLEQELIFHMAVRDQVYANADKLIKDQAYANTDKPLTAAEKQELANKAAAADLYREILAYLKRKAAREPVPIAAE